MNEIDIRLLAFYLPQFHPVPENDEWWGKGFTEWRNVAKGQPLFRGHYQPHLPADLGFYDLRLDETRNAQADLAREYGIHGFCYYHYWFNGRRILERPFNEVLSSGEPDFPFCLCWANENWTRVWDGGEKNILLEQRYSLKDDEDHIRSLLPAFSDQRYIRIVGKPLFLVYRTELLPEPERTANLWREIALKEGIGELYLARVEGFVAGSDPKKIGFDAAVEFAPDWRNMGSAMNRGRLKMLGAKLGLVPRVFTENSVVPYDEMVKRMMQKKEPDYARFRCVTPGFDNSARRSKNAAIFVGSTPEMYQQWLSATIAATVRSRLKDERIVFINAWNEWGEGNHLEPDQKWGRAFLDATRRALAGYVGDNQ